jgi:hypothetical protein
MEMWYILGLTFNSISQRESLLKAKIPFVFICAIRIYVGNIDTAPLLG